ncbi:MAG: hypothetical protein EOS51_18150 [Mesorhizobium sp.]|uniref:hypothetical protein n=1 Tax=unclassified Mesorhizobium TaxID=325217 RepID=UPI000FE4EFD6|nr:MULTISPECIES: hypothetical protein [unclassified Mesorhizobium]RWC17052.1 MAG: hypothetical protein EOS51_18150 [Mesorhizobium sp.]TGU01268.1 hypothetical protein EN807_16440 [Mesorhizobium sp. M5C.F.Ca.ET.164.01.1.1]
MTTGRPPFRLQTPLEEALSEAMHPKAPPASSGLLDAPWMEEMRRQCDVDPEYRKKIEALRDQHQADPIFTPIFTAILGVGQFTLFGTPFAYAAVASAIATTAFIAGVQIR